MCKTIKYNKRMLSLILSVIIATAFIFSGGLFQVYAGSYAESDIHNGEIAYMKTYYDAHKDACDAMAYGILNMDEKINLSEYRLPTSDATTLMTVTFKMHPEIFYLSFSYSYSYSKSTNSIIYITPDYIGTEDEVNRMRAEFERSADSILSLLNNKMSQLQKAIIIHDEIVLNCEYVESKITAYDALVNHKANCQGYTAAYSYLLSRVGINSEVIGSDQMLHEWNKICIDGNYYHADLSWDDTIPDRKGHVNHNYFMYSDAGIYNAEHYGFEDNYYKATDTGYDNSELHNIDTRLCYNGTDFYAINNSCRGEYSKSLIKYDPATENISVIKRLGYIWSAGSGYYWADAFSSLDIYGEALYINSDKEIFIIDPKTGTTYEYKTNAYRMAEGDYYGLLVKNGELYAALTTNPAITAAYVKAGVCDNNPFDIGKELTAVVSSTRRIDVKLGDVNGDNSINVKDVTEIQKYLAGFVNFNKKQEIEADINRDGKITVVDATDIQRFLIL